MAPSPKAIPNTGPSYQDHHFRSNVNLGPRITPTIPDGGKWSVYAEIDIPTPPVHPYNAIIDIHDWREWNTFTPDVLVTKHPHPHSRTLKMEQGTFMTFTVQMTREERQSSKEVCRHLEPLKHVNDGHKSHESGGNVTRIRWCLDNANLLAPSFILKTERVNEIEESQDGKTCKYRTWITFSGLGANSMKKKFGEALQARVVDYCEDLKERSIKLQKEEQAKRKGNTGGVNGNAAGANGVS
ncbi:Hypothetical predicted protein [Lecanosticta acicola]|uniref:Coenzyme Q-binding protein COQ10 START domain-containing protein n=1 Tax=Lecanosticta acicola TaxID=111012 RepID=A0AAI9EC75_9PEZI|nr:Hypothetical predicted protein [Lecanosticta acicola]